MIAIAAALAGASPALPPPVVLGIEIGAPLAIPECAKRPPSKRKLTSIAAEAEKRNPYVYSTDRSCHKRLGRSDAPLGTETVHIAFPYAERLPLISDYVLAVQLVEGRVQFLRGSTSGRSTQEADLSTLIGKFGEPTSLKPIELQNGFGAKFMAVDAEWVLPGGWTVSFVSYGGFQDKGNFEIGSKAGNDLFYAKLRTLLTPNRAF